MDDGKPVGISELLAVPEVRGISVISLSFWSSVALKALGLLPWSWGCLYSWCLAVVVLFSLWASICRP